MREDILVDELKKLLALKHLIIISGMGLKLLCSRTHPILITVHAPLHTLRGVMNALISRGLSRRAQERERII